MILSILLVQSLLVQASYLGQQRPLTDLDRPDFSGPSPSPTAISTSLFASLERLARLVDTAYCLGSTGIHRPFECLSRCKEFPEMRLAKTWSTGVLFGDNCGFIAVDHGSGGQLFAGETASAAAANTTTPAEIASALPSAAAHAQGTIVVAFRGTYSIANTIYDLATLPQKYVPYPSPDHGGGGKGRGAPSAPDKPSHECPNCTVHMGFLHSWRNARGVVLPELKALRARYPAFPVHLVGHSLGGAVACLAALELRVSLGWEDVSVTTFGEPRVGNDGLARFVDDVFAVDAAGAVSDEPNERKGTYRRVTHADDPVPLLPPTELGFRSHAGEIFIAKAALSPTEDDVLVCSGDEDPRCSAGADESVVKGSLRCLLAQQDSGRVPRSVSMPVSLSGSGLGASPAGAGADVGTEQSSWAFPARLKLWQILFAHRDYFWRLGLCIPGGDPSNWGRGPYTPDPRD